MTQPQRLEACVRWLSAELVASGGNGTVPQERVEASLRDLKARGVLRDDGEFYRPLLRELLRRRSGVLRDDRDSQLILLRLAVDDVEWPENAERRDAGGQAQIYIQSRGERTLAYRACSLDSDESRRRFARTCAALKTLRDRRTKLPGDDHLPRVMEAGFRSDDIAEGVIVYEWVEGESFEHLWPQLPPQGRAHIVRQIAKAVMALHARDVIHCDIAPRNIIVNSRLEATLIDFGLARRTDHSTVTRLAPDLFKAPEQWSEHPSADKASDIYALAMLLRGPNNQIDSLSPQFRKLVTSMSSHNAADRPSVVDVVRELDGLVDFEPLLHQLRSKVEDVVNDAPEWLWEDLLHFAGSATLVHGDYLFWDEQRAMEVSFLLNNLFVRIVAEKVGTMASALAACGEGEEVSLAAVRGKIRSSGEKSLRAWEGIEVKAVGLMRNAWSHPKDRRSCINDAMRELKSTETRFKSDIQAAVSKVAGMLDGLASIESGAIGRFIEFYTKRK
jgi:serine/threonine protein kinase